MRVYVRVRIRVQDARAEPRGPLRVYASKLELVDRHEGAALAVLADVHLVTGESLADLVDGLGDRLLERHDDLGVVVWRDGVELRLLVELHLLEVADDPALV